MGLMRPRSSWPRSKNQRHYYCALCGGEPVKTVELCFDSGSVEPVEDEVLTGATRSETSPDDGWGFHALKEPLMAHVPRTQVQPSKKSRIAALVEQVVGLQKQMLELRQEIRPLIEREVEKSLGDKYHMIVSTLNDVMVQRKIFIEKGFITRDEIEKKYEELKAGG